MARWDEILSLPVQNPPTLEFASVDLVWSKVEGWRDNIDRVALIPFARVDDFVRGESSNKDCPTRFHVEARRRRPPEMPYKPKVDGILEYILYWCSFGPDDHRKGGIVRPSRNTYIPKKKNAGRPNTKRGCTCHFIVKRLIAEPSVALIIYNQDKHVDKKGLPCHGPQDKKAAGTRAMFAPYISEDLRLRVLSLLYVGVSVETIMQRHHESVERQGGPCNRDDLLTHRYVRRQERSIRRSTYELDEDDAVSINMWVESHQSHVFFFEDFSDSDPFILGIQTEWQLQQMIRFGNRSLLASDSRFGTNKLKYPVHSLVVFNSDNKAIPVAWIIAPRFASADAHRWMRALYNRVQTKDPTWRLAGFIVDDPLFDVLTIRDVFQCSVLVSFWRVRHAWHKNLVKRCLETEMRIEVSRRLGQAIDDICRGYGTAALFEDFVEDFVDAFDFMDYFKATWYPRLGVWTTALQTFPLASQETCAAMEFYHNQLKVRLLNEKDPAVYQRADWLVDKLGTKVHSYFWLDEYSGKDDFARYWKDEWVSGLTSWRRALKIPDSDVVVDGRCAKVTLLDQDKTYIIGNPGSQFGLCNCSWADMGYLCEHVLKVIKLYRAKGSIEQSTSLFQYKQALINMLNCPPYDSLIRDHAVSLAVSVGEQLNSLLDFGSSQASEDTAHKQTGNTTEQKLVGSACTEQDRELTIGNHPTDEDASSHNENGSANGDEAPARGSSDLAGEQSDQAVKEKVICGKTIGEEISGVEMDIDPSSICISSSGPLSVGEIVFSDVFSEGERVLFETVADVSANLPYQHGTQDEFKEDISNKDCDQDMMALEPPSTEAPLSNVESLAQCSVAHENGVLSNDAEPSLVSDTAVGGSQSDKTSPAMSMPIELQVLDMGGASHADKEKKVMESKIENENTTKILHHVNDAATLGNCDNVTNNSVLGHDEAIDSNLAAWSEALPNCLSMPSYSENQLPAEVATEETGSHRKLFSSNEPLLVSCKHQIDAENENFGNCDHMLITQQEFASDQPAASGKGVVSRKNTDIYLSRISDSGQSGMSAEGIVTGVATASDSSTTASDTYQIDDASAMVCDG